MVITCQVHKPVHYFTNIKDVHSKFIGCELSLNLTLLILLAHTRQKLELIWKYSLTHEWSGSLWKGEEPPFVEDSCLEKSGNSY